MSKSTVNSKPTPRNHQKFEEIEIREREANLARTLLDIELVKVECARRNVEILSRLDIHSGLKHEDLSKEVLEAIRSNLSILKAK